MHEVCRWNSIHRVPVFYAGWHARAHHYVSHRSSSYAGTATTPVTLLTLPTFCKSQELCSPPSLTFSPPPVDMLFSRDGGCNSYGQRRSDDGRG